MSASENTSNEAWDKLWSYICDFPEDDSPATGLTLSGTAHEYVDESAFSQHEQDTPVPEDALIGTVSPSSTHTDHTDTPYVPETAHSEHSHPIEYSSTEIASNDYPATNDAPKTTKVNSYRYDDHQQAPLDEFLSGSVPASYDSSYGPNQQILADSADAANPKMYSTGHTSSEFGPNDHASNVTSPPNVSSATVDNTFAHMASGVPYEAHSANSTLYENGYPTSQPTPLNSQDVHYQTNMTTTQSYSWLISDATQSGSPHADHMRRTSTQDIKAISGSGYSTSQAVPSGSQNVHYQTSSQSSATIQSSSTSSDRSSDQAPAAQAPAGYYMNAPTYSQQHTITPATATFAKPPTAQDNHLLLVQAPQNYNANDRITPSESVHSGSSSANSFRSQPIALGSKHRATYSTSARAHPYELSQAHRNMRTQGSNPPSLRMQALTRSIGGSLFPGTNSTGGTPKLSGAPTSASLTPPVATSTFPTGIIHPMAVQSPNAEPGLSDVASPKMIRSPFPSKFDPDDFNEVKPLGIHQWIFFITSWAATLAGPEKPAEGKQKPVCQYANPANGRTCDWKCCEDKGKNPTGKKGQKGQKGQKGPPLETISLEEYLRHLWDHREQERELNLPISLRTIWFDEALDFQKSRDEAAGSPEY
ncbi:hypothetical protein FRC09_015151 [Ceratobasidium sp. 395]|nr:hypothetical protein FRC09_015151 [Ceratobasidium sp. 395]